VQFAVIDSCPVPVEMAGRVAACKRASGLTLNSCFRGSEAKALLRRLGKMDQPTLYWGWINRLPGYNPANPPKNSPHECYSDGVSPPGYRRGQRIPNDMCGEDWSNGPAAINVYRRMGVPAYRPYSDGREVQHVGMSRRPKGMAYIPNLMVGSKDKKYVVQLKRRLAFVPRPKDKGGKVYYPGDKKAQRSPIFTDALEDAVKRFQRDHGLKDDGIVGSTTWAQLDYSTSYWKRRFKKAARKAKVK
jgi:hypothetical protein